MYPFDNQLKNKLLHGYLKPEKIGSF